MAPGTARGGQRQPRRVSSQSASVRRVVNTIFGTFDLRARLRRISSATLFHGKALSVHLAPAHATSAFPSSRHERPPQLPLSAPTPKWKNPQWVSLHPPTPHNVAEHIDGLTPCCIALEVERRQQQRRSPLTIWRPVSVFLITDLSDGRLHGFFHSRFASPGTRRRTARGDNCPRSFPRCSACTRSASR